MSDRETAVAEAMYEACEWSGCAGSGWGRVPQMVRDLWLERAAVVLAALDGLPATPDDGAVAASTYLHEQTSDLGFMQALQREEVRWRRGNNTRSLAHLRQVMHSLARVIDGTAALYDATYETAAALAADPADTGATGEGQ